MLCPSNIKQHVFCIGNPASENRHWTNMFFSLENWRWKTNVGPACYFHQKPNVRKPTLEMCFCHWKSGTRKVTSGQSLFFIGNLTSQKSPWANMFFFNGKIRFQKMDITLTCFLYPEFDVRNPKLGRHVYFIENPKSENQQRLSVLFSSENKCWKTDFRQRVFFIKNPASENRCWANRVFSL